MYIHISLPDFLLVQKVIRNLTTGISARRTPTAVQGYFAHKKLPPARTLP